MPRFRHSRFVRTIALLLTLDLTLWSCASAPTETEKVAEGRLYYAPVPVDSALVVWRKNPGSAITVTMTDSAIVSLDFGEPQFYGGQTVELVREIRSRADTLMGQGAPPGAEGWHAYTIPAAEIATLELQPKKGGGGRTVGIVIGVVLVSALVVGLIVAADPCIDTGLGEC